MRHRPGRSCDNFDHFNKQFASKVNVKNPKVYRVCGVNSCNKCGLWNVSAVNDATLIGKKRQPWRVPCGMAEKNKMMIKYLTDEESDEH
eukprot:12452098-Ditylum_brightwellii.AAC.1